jgi:hypothetical protein
MAYAVPAVSGPDAGLLGAALLPYLEADSAGLSLVVEGAQTAGPSTALRFGPNEQKIKPIESISIFSVHFTLNLPQASRLLGMTNWFEYEP